MTKEFTPRPISTIAAEIRREWKNVNYAAVPYLDAMTSLDKPTDWFGLDSAKEIVIYFLSNATGWRGDSAKRIKAELKQLIGVK